MPFTQGKVFYQNYLEIKTSAKVFSIWYFAFTHDTKTMVYVPIINLLSLSSKPTHPSLLLQKGGWAIEGFFSFDNWYAAEFCQWKALCWRDLSGGRSDLLPRWAPAVRTVLWRYSQGPMVLTASPPPGLVVRVASPALGSCNAQGPAASQIIPWGGFVVVPMVRHLPVDSFAWRPRE